MREELTSSLKSKFPDLFKDYNYGFAVGDGWYTLIEELAGTIQQHIDNRKYYNENCVKFGKEPLPEINVTVQQIKEKFGGLRFYVMSCDEYIRGVIDMAEVMSFKTCEVCGASGEARDLSWIRTLCDKHFKEASEKRNSINSHDLTSES